MRDNVAFGGGAALVIGILLGVIADRLARGVASGTSIRAATPRPRTEPRQTVSRASEACDAPEEPVGSADVLERYRAAAAV